MSDKYRYITTFFLPMLTLMLKPRPPFACLRSVTVLCFRTWEFLIGKKIFETLRQYCESHRPWILMNVWSPLARTYIYLGLAAARANHIQLLYGQSVSGQFQEDVVGIVGLLIVQQGNSRFSLWGKDRGGGFEERWQISPSRAIIDTMNIFWCLVSPLYWPLVNIRRLSASPSELTKSELLTSRKSWWLFQFFFIFFWQITNHHSSSVNVSDKLRFKLGFFRN